ncbi:MAG: sulfite exporter TauE/SafE family protein [Candidatus Sulfopaludibacter sp.]|nr:sulfite exporter TauE/SafE family protein [Candidatus Sulfopaludibacter sp.]
MHFPVSGVDCPIWLPPAVAFFVALVATPAGVSGAFLLLPFQMSVLGFVSPAVTPTNLIYNVVSVPGGVGKYIKDRRMVWPIAWVIAVGTLPGIFVGSIVRIRYLPDPRYCKAFVGCVLLYLGARLLNDAFHPRLAARVSDHAVVKGIFVSAKRMGFEFEGRTYSFKPATLAAVSLVVGVIGGIYGVGGGAMIAPFAMTVLDLPAYTVAGAALLGTLVTSVAGVGFFEVLGGSPDWVLGLLFGVGGLAGSYCGARLQKHVPERFIRLLLGLLVTGLALRYVIQFFL